MVNALYQGSHAVSATVEVLARNLAERLTGPHAILVGMALTHPGSGRTLPVDLLLVTPTGIFAGQDGEQKPGEPSPGKVVDLLAEFIETEWPLNHPLHLYGFWIGRVGAGHQPAEEIAVLAGARALHLYLEAASGPTLTPDTLNRLVERLRALDRGRPPGRRSPVSYMRSALRDLADVPARIDATLQEQVRRPFLFRHKGPLLPADLNRHLEKAMFAREHHIEGADYTKIVPNEYVVELNPGNLRRNFQPIASTILDDWRERLVQSLHTGNDRWGRREYQFGGPLVIRLAAAAELSANEVRIRCRVNPTPAEEETAVACLGLVDGSRVWLLDQERVTIGRDPGNNIHLDMPAVQVARLVSSRHAYISFENGVYTLHDGSPAGKPSTNGTFANGRRLGSGGYRLQDGDLITLAAEDTGAPGREKPGAVSFLFHRECPLDPE